MRKEEFMDADFLLIRKMKQGNDDAFDQFVRKYYEEILKYCNYHCHDAEYAKDITQETFIRFFINLSEYHYRGKTKNYLYTIAGNLCKNFYKKKKEAILEDNLFETTYVQDTRQLDIVLDHIIIEDAIKKLPKELREVVILYYFQEPEDTKFARSQGFQDITRLISVAFSEPGEYNYYLCNSISPEKASRLYERRISRLKKEITKIEEGLEGSFSQKERAFLLRQYNNLETPLYYEYSEGWKALLDSQYLPTLMIITTVIIAFFVSGIFSDEFRTKADSIFFLLLLAETRQFYQK